MSVRLSARAFGGLSRRGVGNRFVLAEDKMVERICAADIPVCGEVIRKAFTPVAARFGITCENTPRHTSFIADETLLDQYNAGRAMYKLTDGGEICGYFSINVRDGMYELDNLAVLPERQGAGFGSQMVRFAFDEARKIGASELFIGVIDEYTELKIWYGKLGFQYLGSKKFPGFCFTAGFMKAVL